MINIINKKDCVGCNACVQVCPVKCIGMIDDEQGFFYPKVNLNKCINCHLCEKVCPVINQGEERTDVTAFAAKNKRQEIEHTSSSGGVFYALASRVINEGGVVFGACFNSRWQVVHGYAEDLEGLKAFQGSKYVQSQIGDSFLQVERFLKEGRKILFSGTPCQTAGLRLFLRKDYAKQLTLVDTACHGVPSPLVWTKFLDHISKENGFDVSSITSISFRDKRNGWNRYGMRIEYEENGSYQEWFCLARDNTYMQGFLKDLYIRPSCFACPAKCGKSKSDITIADFWGIQRNYPELFNKGLYSLIVMEDRENRNLLETGDLEVQKVDVNIAIRCNPALVKSAIRPKQYFKFWQLWSQIGFNAISEILKYMQPSLKERLKDPTIKIFEKIIGRERLTKCIVKIKGKKLIYGK